MFPLFPLPLNQQFFLNKHIKLNCHFVQEKIEVGALVTPFVSSANQVANILTKPLAKKAFLDLRLKNSYFSLLLIVSSNIRRNQIFQS